MQFFNRTDLLGSSLKLKDNSSKHDFVEVVAPPANVAPVVEVPVKVCT